MIPVLSREQMRELDRYAIEHLGISGLALMENAGRGAAGILARELGSLKGTVVVVCGPGNNGGDGYVVARRLRAGNREVRVVSTVPLERLRGDAAANCRAWIALGGDVTVIATEAELARFDEAAAGAHVVVDALFGTGLDREIEGRAARLIERMNRCAARRISLDVPSGLDANTGRVLGVCVQADTTVTFAHPKLGLLTTSGAERSGRLEVADIGIPADTWPAVGRSAAIAERGDVAAAVGRRSSSEHKGSAGRVLIVAGSAGKIGAALLVARGALRAGAGLVTLANEPEVTAVFDRRVLEAMTAAIDPDHLDGLRDLTGRADTIAIGPGLGLGERARRLVEEVVLRTDKLVVVDADAISHFADRADLLKTTVGRLILTPHPGELGRLLGVSVGELEGDRFSAMKRAVEATGQVVLLKGPRTLVGGPGRDVVVNPTGSAVLATGGSGDVLTGVAAALGCKLEAFEAAFCAAYVHGRSGQRWSSTDGADRGMLAREIADGVPGAIAELSSSSPSLTD